MPESGTINKSYDENLNYDKNGNIINLTRNGGFETFGQYPAILIDNLIYTYSVQKSNQLMKVYDQTNNPKGFKDDAQGIPDLADDYDYDDNGNLTKDDNKGITAITYNHLNLP